MTKSLNRAFIKAYSKEITSRDEQESTQVNAPEPKQQHQGQQNDTDDSVDAPLIAYFDTATVAVPRPHLLDRSQSSGEAVSASPGRTPSMNAAASSAPDQEQSDASLRDSIASQMMQAGAWEEQLNAFLSGFPTPTNTEPGQNGESTMDERREIADVPRSVEPPQLSKSQRVPALAPGLGSSSENSAQNNPNPPSVEASAGETQSSAPEPPPIAPPPIAPPPIAPPPIEPPPLEPPKSPAIGTADVSQNSENHLDSPQTTQSSEPAPTASAQIPLAASREGDIFRLDRPTYASTDNQDSGEQSSIVDSTKGRRSSGGPSKQNTLADSADIRAAEESLRNARVRVFNPVWEVDNLQWPEVCHELLEHSSSDMDRVADNLNSACEEGLQVLAITSPQSGEGKTTVACCLSMLAGSRGLKVAILDGDIENPSLSYQTNLEVEQDWKSAMNNEMPLEEVAVHSIDDQVTIIPLTQPIGNSEMAADASRIAEMIQELSDSFDLVIVDMGHMSSSRSLVTTMGEHGIVSAVVAVVDRRSSTQNSIDSCVRKIRRSGIASIGLVENFAA